MDKVIVKTGEIFTAGNYPDKKFKLTADELPLVVQQFKAPVSLDLDHKTTIQRLDSKLGKLTSIWHKDDKIFGRVEIPEWLNNVACKDEEGNDLPLQVSCAFGPDKAIKKLALTDNPRVPTAAVFAAFSAAHPDEAKEVKEELVSVGAGELANESQFSSELIKELVEFAKKNTQTHEGQSVLQQVHDILARAGAICNPDTELHSADELNAIQAAHDEMVAAGAICRALKEGERPCTWFNSELSEPADVKTRGDNMEANRVSLVHDILKFINGEKAAPVTEVEPEKKVFSAGTLGTAVALAPEKPEKPEDNTELSSKVDELTRALADEQEKTKKLIADGIAAQSRILANEIIAGKHAQEKDRASLETAFSQALTDDQANPTEITFSGDKKGNRVDALKALFSARTIIPLTEETVNEEETETLLSNEGQGQDDEKKRKLEAVAERARKLAERKNQRLAARK